MDKEFKKLIDEVQFSELLEVCLVLAEKIRNNILQSYDMPDMYQHKKGVSSVEQIILKALKEKRNG
jgi:hypothetical protein